MTMTKFNRGHLAAAKLTPTEVQELRRLYIEEGWTQGRLARRFRLSVGQVGRIVRGEAWQQYSQEPHPDEIQDSLARLSAAEPIMPPDDLMERLIKDMPSPSAGDRVPTADAVTEYLKRARESNQTGNPVGNTANVSSEADRHAADSPATDSSGGDAADQGGSK